MSHEFQMQMVHTTNRLTVMQHLA